MMRVVLDVSMTFTASKPSFMRFRFVAGGANFDIISPWPERWTIGGATSSSDPSSCLGASRFEDNFSP
jgi:hypothetical protein